MEVEFSAQAHPNVARFRQLRARPICAADSQRAREYVAHLRDRGIERRRIFWRGDRIEWILARGCHERFLKEIKEGRVLWPGPALPAPLRTDVRRA